MKQGLYPMNLANDIGIDTERLFIPGLLESVCKLSDREKAVLRMRYEEGKTLRKAGEEMGVTSERVRQIEAKALRKLRHPRFKRLYLTPLPDVDPVDDVKIEAMRLSFRTLVCLKRAGYNTIEDLKDDTVNKLLKCRNLGRKSLEEIIERLKDYRIEVNE